MLPLKCYMLSLGPSNGLTVPTMPRRTFHRLFTLPTHGHPLDGLSRWNILYFNFSKFVLLGLWFQHPEIFKIYILFSWCYWSCFSKYMQTVIGVDQRFVIFPHTLAGRPKFVQLVGFHQPWLDLTKLCYDFCKLSALNPLSKCRLLFAYENSFFYLFVEPRLLCVCSVNRESLALCPPYYLESFYCTVELYNFCPAWLLLARPSQNQNLRYSSRQSSPMLWSTKATSVFLIYSWGPSSDTAYFSE